MEIRKIQLVHTENEWALLEQEAKKRGFDNFREMFNYDMRDLNKNINMGDKIYLPGCGECDKKRNNMYDVDMELIKKIEALSHPYCMPVTSIIRYYTTDPILVTKRLNPHF